VTASPVRTPPLVAVLSHVPLFVEAVRAAFNGIADVQPVPPDDVGVNGLVRAFNPSAVIIEGFDLDVADLAAPCIRVDLVTERVSILRGGAWAALDIELSPEAVRNVVVAALFGGDPA
jgi:hypothetical protein